MRLATLFLTVTTVYGHMKLHFPPPFEFKLDGLDTAPLASDGSDYPCKFKHIVGYDTPSDRYLLRAGQEYPVQFVGGDPKGMGAPHGGGSCQVSLSTDLSPTARSEFHVVYSMMGGCPTQNFTLRLPPEIPSGPYTFSWTWYNEIGFREMYQNCAPVRVDVNAKADMNFFRKLPLQAVYNIPSLGRYGTVENKDVIFDDPGSYVSIVGSNLAPPTLSALGSPLTTFTSMEGGVRTASEVVPKATTPAVNPGPSLKCVDGALVCNPLGDKFGICNKGQVQFQAVAAGTQCVDGAIRAL